MHTQFGPSPDEDGIGGNTEWWSWGEQPVTRGANIFPIPALLPGLGIALAVSPTVTGMAPPPTPMPWPRQAPAESAPAAAAGGPTAAAPVRLSVVTGLRVDRDLEVDRDH